MSLRRLLSILLLAASLALAAGWYWLLHTESGLRWIWSKAAAASGGALQAASVTGDLGSGARFEQFEYGDRKVVVTISTLDFDADVDLLPPRLTVGSARVAGAVVEIPEGESAAGEPADLQAILANLQLPVEIVVSALEISDVRIATAGAAQPFTLSNASVSGRWHDTVELRNLEAELRDVAVRGDARLDLYEPNDLALNVDLLLQPDVTGFDHPTRISAKLEGPLDDLRVRAEADAPAAILTGKISGVPQAVHWDLELDMPGFVLPAQFEVPETPPMNVAAHGAGDMKSFLLDAEIGFAGTTMQLGMDVSVDVESAAVTGEMQWQDARWPVSGPEPRLASPSGRVSVAGTFDDWSVKGDVALDVPQLPPGQFTINGRGNRDRASVAILDGKILGGTLSGRAEYTWREQQAYSANLQFDDIHTSSLLPAWPAVLNGSVELRGRQQPFELEAVLTGIDGELLGRTLQADGRLAVHGKTISADDLRVRHGGAELRVDGQPDSAEGLRYELVVDDLSRYLEQASGSISASGAFSLHPDHQFLRVDASSSALGYGDIRIADLAIRDLARDDSMLHAEIVAGELAYADTAVREVRLQTRIDRDAQSIDLDFVAIDGLAAGLSLEGELDDWSEPTSWTGELTRLLLEHEDYSASLAEPAGLALTDESVVANRLCLIGERGVELCADGSWHRKRGYETEASVASVPVDLVNAFVDTGLRFDQTISGNFRWQTVPGAASSGHGDISVTAGKIVNPDRPRAVVKTGEGRLAFDVVDDDLQSGIVSLPLPGLGQIAGEFEVLGVVSDTQRDVNGTIDVDLSDIGFVTAFVPALDNMRGSFRADMDVSGRVDAPALTGSFRIDNAGLSYLPLGLELDEIDLTGSLPEHDEIEVTGSLRAGDGQARIHTRADALRSDAADLEFQITGSDLAVINVPDMQAVADIDVGVRFDGRTLDLDGKIAVPRAVVRPAVIGAGRVSESDDVVIVAGELPDIDDDGNGKRELSITGSLEVALEDNVVIDLDVTQAKVTGNTLFTFSGEPMPRANGRYDVVGQILAFGQKLDITEGIVRFNDVPADNPQLRIRAERDIFGNTQVRHAGVLVAGTARRPSVEAYTTPPTTEERALTLLVTGSDFDYDRGVGAFDFGTYIAPRVYASYGIGLFDTQNVIRIRYDLTKGLGITATSGQKDSGVDLSYRFEN